MSTIYLQPLVQAAVPYLNTAIAAVVTGFVGWGAAILRKYLHIRISAHALDIFDHAVAVQAGKWVALQAEGWEKQTVQEDNPFIAFGANEILRGLPHELESSGMTQEKIRDMILAKIGALQAQALSGAKHAEKVGA